MKLLQQYPHCHSVHPIKNNSILIFSTVFGICVNLIGLLQNIGIRWLLWNFYLKPADEVNFGHEYLLEFQLIYLNSSVRCGVVGVRNFVVFHNMCECGMLP